MADPAARTDFEILPLASSHDRRSFSCGEPKLDEFLRNFASQNESKDLTRTYILVEKASPTVVVGFSSARYGQVAFDELPEAARKGLPRYPVPTFHIARFAVASAFQGAGLGELLLLHALRAAQDSAEKAGLFAVEVVAKTEAAKAFYGKYGFKPLLDDTMHLYLSMKVVRSLHLR